MFGQGGRGKKRTELERLLRQDHSDVYFDNERLNDLLGLRIDDMQKELHRHDIQRGVEIGKLRQEIKEFRASQFANQQEREQNEAAPRPHTSVGHSTRKRTATPSVKKRAQSAWARTNSRDTVDAGADATEEESEQESPRRSNSVTSSVSTLRNNKTLRRYRNIGPNSFKENNRFPEEWYIKCLPSSDAAIHNARKKVKGMFTASNFGFLGKIREKEEMEKKLERYSQINPNLTTDNKTLDNGDVTDGTILVCDDQVKPVLMSRRRLMEISNNENCVDREPSRNTVRKQNIKETFAFDNKRIDHKVEEFCREIEELKIRELKEMKEREEARRKAEQERLQMKRIEKIELQKRKAGQINDDEDDEFMPAIYSMGRRY